MYSVSLKKVSPLVTCLPLKKVRGRGKGSYWLVCPWEWSLIILIISWNTETCCMMLNCKRKSVNIKRKRSFPSNKWMHFISLRVSKGRRLSVEGGKKAVSRDKRGRGTWDGNKAAYGCKECRVREAQYSDPQIHLPNLSLWKSLYLKTPVYKKKKLGRLGLRSLSFWHDEYWRLG